MTLHAIRPSRRPREPATPVEPPAYAELQTTTNFSFLRGGSHPHELVAQAKLLGHTALAITDRNTLAGVVRAYTAAKEAGLRFIVGVRLDLIDAPSLLCLPTDRAAYGRLCRLLSFGQMRSVKGQCDIALDDLAGASTGQILIALPPDGWNWRQSSERARLEASLRRLKSKLAAATLYLATTHDYSGGDRARIAVLDALGRRCGLPLVATGDVLYHTPHRRSLQDVLTCIREGVRIADAGLILEPNAERHLKSPREIARLFAGHEAALARTIDIANACTFDLGQLKQEHPEEPVPPGKTPHEHLVDLVEAGALQKFPAGLPDKIRINLDRELALIAQLEYAPYFLTVHDIVSFARTNKILCQGRGSAANSVVCFCLDITAVNPTEVELLFERFISADRREPPDIDVDFEHTRREEVIQYIYERYGRDRAGLAATVISYRSRSAVREVGKAMGLTEDVVAALAGMIWGMRSNGALPAKRVHEAGLDPGDPLLQRVLELTEELIGFPRHLSQHVGGFVLTRGPLVETVPVGNGAMKKRTFIEWDKDDLAAVGLMKVDVLALGMLTCIRRAFELIAIHEGRYLTLATTPRDDEETYDMLCRAESIGVFQVESRAQMNMLPRLKPRCFYDLVIEVAIVRPGPIQGDMVHPYLRRRDGIEKIEFPAPKDGSSNELESILGKTMGVPLFQEQAMRIAMTAAEFTDSEVNELRKAMATFRRRGTIGLLEEKMVSRMVRRGYEREFAERCFNQIKGFGEYGFPESHAASFALLVYVSAWLKRHHPAAFCAALLNSQPMGFYAPAQLVRDARENGVEAREADINHSNWESTLETNDSDGRPALRLGFRQIDGMAEKEVEHLVAARSAAPFIDVQDLWMRGGVRLETIERLAAADSFRSIGLDRRQALWEVKALNAAIPLPLFAWSETREAGSEPEVTLPVMPLSQHVVNDYQTTRLSLKAHPMAFLRVGLARRRILACQNLSGCRDGQWVSVAGVILVRQQPGTAKGVVFMTIEDETGIANIVVWRKTMERFHRVVMASRLIVVHGRIQRKDEIIHLVSSRLEDRSQWLGLLSEQGRADMPVAIARADEVLRPNPGLARSPEPSRRAGHPRNERILPKSRDFH